jgi:hypothetical protein
MLKTIVNYSVKLASFVLALELALYQPQMQHLIRLVDVLIVCDSRKALSNLYRQFVEELDPKTAADFLRESPWAPGEVNQARQRFMLTQFLKLADRWGAHGPLRVSVDDSLGKKDKATRHLEAVDFHHNHTESTSKKPGYSNGFVYVEVHVHIGPLGFTFGTRLYLREKTVRRLNRQRRRDNRLRYRSKYALTREMLLELAQLLPPGYPVYVLFDTWYASAKLIKFCRRQGWHVICAIKSNRRLNRKRVDQHDQALRHQHYNRVRMSAVDETRPPSYYVRTLRGHVEDVPGEVCAIISRRHPGDKRPKYFLPALAVRPGCTDLSLSAQEALRHYQQRWPVEVDNFYLKEALGLGDFRLQSFEATEKWFAVVLLAMNYLQYQQAQDYLPAGTSRSLADLIRQHRIEHAQDVLRSVAQEVLRTGSVEGVLRRFIVLDSRAVPRGPDRPLVSWQSGSVLWVALWTLSLFDYSRNSEPEAIHMADKSNDLRLLRFYVTKLAKVQLVGIILINTSLMIN